MLRSGLLLAAGAVLICTAASVFAAVRGDEVRYVGGTITIVPEDTEGRFDMSDTIAAKFIAKKGAFQIPYDKIASLEYGQKAGRRLGVALAVSPIALLSKKRKHFLTISFVDEQGAKQGAVLEIGKGKVKPRYFPA